ncbi:hypothetical protein ACFL5J_02310 [Thermodesulfobacteriota bacterium]
MSFRENLERKIEVDRLACRVIASCGSSTRRRSVDKEAMRRLLKLSTYRYQRQRDLDLYVKAMAGEEQLILVLDNELPIFRSTVKDVVVRRSPRTLDLWSIRTIRKILVDSDIKESVHSESVARVQRDAVAQLDLAYTEVDIERLAADGMVALAASDGEVVGRILALFAELLGYRKLPQHFGLEQVVSFGMPVAGQDTEVAFGPLVLYQPLTNALVWLEGPLVRADKEQLEFLRAVVAGETVVSVAGDAVMQKLQEMVKGMGLVSEVEGHHA